MASPLGPEAALALAFAIAAHGFLEELGKDLYAAFRSGLFAAYRKAKTWANGRGYSPLTAQRHDYPHVYFHFPAGMSQATFEAAFKAFCTFADETVRERGKVTMAVVVEFNEAAQTWVIVREE
jgi:hypothetical protein